MKSDVEDKLIEVDILNQSNFLVIKESLSRVGVSVINNEGQRLFPSCMIVHSNGRYYIGHFKVGFEMNGGYANMSEQDYHRSYTVAKLLEQWGLLEIVNVPFEFKQFSMKGLYIVPFKEKFKWTIIHKFQLGNKGETHDRKYHQASEGTTKTN